MLFRSVVQVTHSLFTHGPDYTIDTVLNLFVQKSKPAKKLLKFYLNFADKRPGLIFTVYLSELGCVWNRPILSKSCLTNPYSRYHTIGKKSGCCGLNKTMHNFTLWLDGRIMCLAWTKSFWHPVTPRSNAAETESDWICECQLCKSRQRCSFLGFEWAILTHSYSLL